jgi:hypothetical protein
MSKPSNQTLSAVSMSSASLVIPGNLYAGAESANMPPYMYPMCSVTDTLRHKHDSLDDSPAAECQLKAIQLPLHAPAEYILSSSQHSFQQQKQLILLIMDKSLHVTRCRGGTLHPGAAPGYCGALFSRAVHPRCCPERLQHDRNLAFWGPLD